MQDPVCEYDLHFQAVMAGPSPAVNTTDITDVVLNTLNEWQSFTILNSEFVSVFGDMDAWTYPRYHVESNDFMHHGEYSIT